MKHLNTIVFFVFLGASAIASNFPLEAWHDSNGPFYRHYEGYINGKPAVMNILKPPHYSGNLFVAFYYYLENGLPIYLDGSHIFYHPKSSYIYSTGAGSLKAEQELLDTLKYVTDTIILGGMAGELPNFRGNFSGDSIFSGLVFNDNTKTGSFYFKETANREKYTYDVASYQGDTVLASKNGLKVKFSLDYVIPYKDGLEKAKMQKYVFDLFSNCTGSGKKATKLYPCVDRMLGDRYPEIKKWTFDWITLESVATVIYHEKNIISFFCLNNFDTDRRGGHRTSVRSYDTKKGKAIGFNDAFQKGSREKVYASIKEKRKRYDPSDESMRYFDENNFYLTNKNIVFVVSGESESSDGIVEGFEAPFPIDEIKNMLNPGFYDMLK